MWLPGIVGNICRGSAAGDRILDGQQSSGSREELGLELGLWGRRYRFVGSDETREGRWKRSDEERRGKESGGG
jgi:hypothetical protein